MTSRSPLHHVTTEDDVTAPSSSPDVETTSGGEASPSVLKTSPAACRQTGLANPLSIGYVMAALVLGIMCLVLGLVYGYIHFTRVSPRLRGALRLFDHAGRGDAHSASTHIFLRNSKSIQAL